MPWRMSETALQGHVAGQVKLINDYTAQALAVEQLGPGDVQAIGPDRPGEPNATIAVVGAGTGFGAGALAKGVGGSAAIATEGGHISFAPVDEVEVELLRLLTRRFGRVSIERLLSGPGLVNLRSAFAEIEGHRPADLASEDVVRQAEAGDPLSAEALDRFCKIYGSVAGDFALMYGARGGVYLGGGIAPAVAPHLQRAGFRERFERKGRFSDYVAAIPTRILTNTYAGLVGAAHLAQTVAADAGG
jgi:glucokinase